MYYPYYEYIFINNRVYHGFGSHSHLFQIQFRKNRKVGNMHYPDFRSIDRKLRSGNGFFGMIVARTTVGDSAIPMDGFIQIDAFVSNSEGPPA